MALEVGAFFRFNSQILPNIPRTKNNVPRDICFRAKQTCEPFPISSNNADAIFNLIQ